MPSAERLSVPSRWFVPIPHLDPARVKLEFVHGAFSGWFDRSEAEHNAGDKPYAVSPPSRRDGHVGVEIGLLNDLAHQRFSEVTQQPTEVRLGNQKRLTAKPRLVQQASWKELSIPTRSREWTLHLLTPTTFRSGSRSSPLPSVETIVAGLRRAWLMWCDEPALIPLPEDVRAPAYRRLWVCDLDLTSTVTELTITRPSGGRETVQMSGCTGSITFRADDDRTAAWAGPLLRLAEYCGVGSMRAKGFGVAELETHNSRSGPGARPHPV